MTYLLMFILVKGSTQAIQVQIPFEGAKSEQVCEQRKDTLIDRYIIKSIKVVDAYCITTSG